ncbi:polyprenyl synthetase family protein [Membranicola marinus]|uniref:Polyprenyl synthetase family protein n=1 Tax=Membranihabitans marinus TaxID=1227546 RepID=A0A953HXS1_9BACT|nr:polyprenyl synthetase family protein [Membranihabitans marinus]MBY5960096.1 polyprenyl synthetase family protein [Membranihabitans marinus]
MTEKDFIRPADWPEENGTIDLNIHDLPHRSSSTEWWYINGHFTGENDQEYSIFASFFRKLIHIDESTKLPEYGHSILWAIIDVENEKYYSNSLVDKKAPEIGIKRLKKGELLKDKFLRKAAIEMLEKNAVPYPDRLFEGEVSVDLDQLSLKFDTNTFHKTEDGTYKLQCIDLEHQVSFSLEFTPQKPVIKNGRDGVVHGVSSDTMYYYFIPRNAAKGTIEIENSTIDIVGSAWYDHEFGRPNPTEDDGITSVKMDTAWNWVSGQLDNGCEFTAATLLNLEDRTIGDSGLLVIDGNGKRIQVDDFSLEPAEEVWTSMRTFCDYPLKWFLKAPEIGLDLTVRASFAMQEFSTLISKQAFWEGRINVEGQLFHKPVKGVGFQELNGYNTLDTLEDFFKVVSRETIASVKHILPRNPDEKALNTLITNADSNRFSMGVDAAVYTKSVIDPIRSVIDRGGKSWRSYAALACCDVVGGDPQKARHWLSLPELMHVGSLIVDDVQDQSAVRRGGPACHELYGSPLAINAGSACYFISQICVYSDHNIADSDKLKIYEYYFEALRAGHSGQALDIYGLDYLMEDVIEDNSGHILEESVLAIHKLKCAAPCYYLARIGSVIGGGSDQQSTALAAFFEALGIAFQIIDDTLNIAGFQNNLKTKAEDITAGKITYPIAKAMHRLNKTDRIRLWQILQCKTEDPAMLKEAVDLLIQVDALKLCEQEAHDIMDEGWRGLDPHVRDSMVKLNLRAFSWFVLERHY